MFANKKLTFYLLYTNWYNLAKTKNKQISIYKGAYPNSADRWTSCRTATPGWSPAARCRLCPARWTPRAPHSRSRHSTICWRSAVLLRADVLSKCYSNAVLFRYSPACQSPGWESSRWRTWGSETGPGGPSPLAAPCATRNGLRATRNGCLPAAQGPAPWCCDPSTTLQEAFTPLMHHQTIFWTAKRFCVQMGGQTIK